MRIGMNLLYLLPSVVGGTQTYATGLLEALGNIVPPSEFVVFVNTETYRCGLFQKGDWHVVHCPVPASSRFARYAWEQFVLPHQVKKYHIDLLHSLGYVQPFRLPCKSVVTIHDLNFLNIGHMMPWSRRIALQFFVKQSAKAADHIITVSEFSKRQIVEVLGVPAEKVTVTYNAVKEVSENPADFEELTQVYGITRPYILGLSSLSPHKNITSLVKAFELLKRKGYGDLKLVLAGHLPVGTSDLKQAVQRSEFCNDILFTGYVPDRILATLYAHAEVFVFPSFYEGFGIPVLEAFLYGTPVACSKVAALPEVAGDAALYFDPNNVQEMADIIGYLLTHEDERRALVVQGKKRVTLFTWEETARRTLDVYRQVLGK
jgi:glycosyltransferase involved in cell wall biosynthesis